MWRQLYCLFSRLLSLSFPKAAHRTKFYLIVQAKNKNTPGAVLVWSFFLGSWHQLAFKLERNKLGEIALWKLKITIKLLYTRSQKNGLEIKMWHERNVLYSYINYSKKYLEKTINRPQLHSKSRWADPICLAYYFVLKVLFVTPAINMSLAVIVQCTNKW